MKKVNKNIKGLLCLPITETAEKEIGDVEKLEATVVKNGVILMKSTMSAMEVVEMLEAFRKISKELLLSITNATGICEDCERCSELEEAVNIQIPNFLLEEAGIPLKAKLCAFTDEDSGEIRVIEAEYQHDLSDVPENILNILKSMGTCMSELNDCIMSEKIIYGK